jgi:hypothetical protein
MSFQELFTQCLQALAPLVPAALGLIVASLTPVLHRHITDRRVAGLMEILANVVAIGVANAYQTVVSDLKNPARPGCWDERAAASVKASVIQDVKQLLPRVVSALAAAGVKDIDALLSRLVEQSVLELRTRIDPRSPAGATGTMS